MQPTIQSFDDAEIDAVLAALDEGPKPEIDPQSNFDYEGLSDMQKMSLYCSTVNIRECRANVRRNFVEIGRDLGRAKKVLGHGRFQKWLKAEFSWTPRAANYFMNIAELAGGLPAEKWEIVSHLPQATLNKLAAPSTPEAARLAFIEKARAGDDIDARTLKTLIQAAKEKACNTVKDGGAAASRSEGPEEEPEARPQAGASCSDSEPIKFKSRSLPAPSDDPVESFVKRLQAALPDASLMLELAEILSSDESSALLAISLQKITEDQCRTLPAIAQAA